MDSCESKAEALEWAEDNFKDDLSDTELESVKAELDTLQTDSDFVIAREKILSENNRKMLEGLLVSTLTDVYNMVEPPIIAKMSSKLLSSQQQEETQKTIELYTQAAPMNNTQTDPLAFLQTQVTELSPLNDLESSQPVLPKSSQDPVLSSQEVPEKIPLIVFKYLMGVCEKDPKTFFAEEDEILDTCYDKYQDYVKQVEADKSLPPMNSLIPKDAPSPVKTVKKQLSFDDDGQLDDDENKKVSLLLPNDSAKRLKWESQQPSDENDKPLVPETQVVEMNYPLSAVQNYIPEISVNKSTKGRRPFSEEEVRYLKEGVRVFGKKWAVILTRYKFNDRTPVDLKDKARNLVKKGEIPPLD